jgi:hypothetical protein
MTRVTKTDDVGHYRTGRATREHCRHHIGPGYGAKRSTSAGRSTAQADQPNGNTFITRSKGDQTMSVTTRREVPVIDSIQSGWPSFDATPLTYSLLRHVLVDSGIMDERDGQKMDRTVGRLLDT